MPKTKRQHTVPRFYLARFCKDGQRFFAFDKKSQKSFPTNVMKVAQQQYFYDIPEDLLVKAFPGQDIDNQFVEKAFSQMETVANPLIAEIINTVESHRVITPAHRLSLAPYIVIQWLRTSLMRNLILEMTEKLMQAVADALVRENFSDLPEDRYPQIEYNRTLLPVVQAQQIFDEDHVVAMSTMISRHIWFIGINDTIQPYYTSDQPVVKKANVFRPGRSFTGLRSPGIEIAFPLSSRYILVMLERSYFQHMAWAGGKAREMDPMGVEHFNALQVLKCHRQIFCEVDEFEQAVGVCRLHPEACSPDRVKVQVIQTEDTIGTLIQE